MDAEEYIATHGGALSESDKRYIRAFGPPQFHEGSGLNPSTPGLQIANAADDEGHGARMDRLDREAGQ